MLLHRAAALAIALGLLLPAAGWADPESDHDHVIELRSVAWNASTGTMNVTVQWNTEEWRKPHVNDLYVAVLARNGETWTRLRTRNVKTVGKKPVASHAITLPASKQAKANTADQLLVAVTQRHGDKPGDFEIAWYDSETAAGKPMMAIERAAQVDCAAIYPDAFIEECPFTGATLPDVDLRKADLNDTHFEVADFRRARLTRAFIARTHLAGADFKDADLRRAVLVRSHMVGVNFTGANLAGADLTTTDLDRARFDNAKLTKARIADARLVGASMVAANLTGADFSLSDLTGANLSGATLGATTVFFETTFCGTTMPDGSVNNVDC
ncbi:MAG: pentapeptide repeat-containing protein [Thermomicrobiales bacterium]